MSTQSPTKPEPIAVHELSEEQLDALLQRIRDARDHGMALSADDYDVLMGAMTMLANMQERLNNNDLTLVKLKKLLGMINSSEKLDTLRPGGTSDKDKPTRPKRSKGTHGRKSTRKPRSGISAIKPTVHHHEVEGLNKGDSCPGCSLGKVYKYNLNTLIRITAHSAFTREKHIIQQLRCNGCGEIFTAELPPEVKADGRVDQQYGNSAIVMIAIQRFFGGCPYYRQESLQQLFGVHIPASTQFDQCKKLSDALQPVFKQLKLFAGNAQRVYLDDTTNRILNKVPIEKERGGRMQWRSGVYTSAALAECLIGEPGSDPPGERVRRLVLFQTNIGHAGEWLDELLSTRDPDLEMPVLMSDALSSNHVTAADYYKALCNVHSRRLFAELVDQNPEACVFALESYEPVWINETHCKQSGYDAEQRLAYHIEHSLPQMLKLKAWCEQEIAESGSVEPNSNLGQAMTYLVRHFEGLSAFCRILNAPVDNNEIEQKIKLIVRTRKNSLFFKTQNGADVSDVITSVLATSTECAADTFHYLQSILRNQLAVRAAPEKWMPWNYPMDK